MKVIRLWPIMALVTVLWALTVEMTIANQALNAEPSGPEYGYVEVGDRMIPWIRGE